MRTSMPSAVAKKAKLFSKFMKQFMKPIERASASQTLSDGVEKSDLGAVNEHAGGELPEVR